MNNKNTKLQFTELTQNDVDTHEDLYTGLLLGQRHKIPDNCIGIYSCYASEELQKAKDLFCKIFK